MPLGATRAVPLVVGGAARRLLRVRGTAVVTTVERGASRKGPRSARRHLRVVG